MRIETHAPAKSTATVFVPDAKPTINQSGIFYDFPHRLSDGKESLATSSDAALLQIAFMELVYDLYFKGAIEDWPDVLRGTQLFPVLVDVSFLRQAEALDSSVATQEQVRLLQLLRATFEAEPLKDGMEHPAETIIGNALRSTEDRRVLDRFRAICLDDGHPNFAASVLRCLGRHMNPGTRSWRADLLRHALAMDDVEIRDAAVQAAEFWSGRDIRNVLEAHSEPVPWLRDCIRDVIEDLGE